MTDDDFKAKSHFEDSNEVIRQVAEYALPGPQPSPDDPAAALLAIDDWFDEWVEIFGDSTPNRFAVSDQLKQFIERTIFLARWCEKEGLDSSPLVEYAHDANSTYYGTHPTLPPTPDGLRVLLDRLKFKLQGVLPPAQGQVAPQERRTVPTDEANILADRLLRKNPNIKADKLAKAIGIARGRVSGLPAWRAAMDRRSANKPQVPKKTRSLTKKMLEAVGEQDDPSAQVEAEDEVWRRLIENATPNERAKLNALSPEKQKELIRTTMEDPPQELLDPDDGRS